jgi:polar amino acid transport system substrate-binding protein
MIKPLVVGVLLAVVLLTACTPATGIPVPAAPSQPTELPLLSGATPNLIAVDSGNPPFMYEISGEAAGLYPLLLKAVFARLGLVMEIKPYPWKRALSMGETGLAGVGGIYKNEKRLEIYDYSDRIYTESLMLYVKKGSGLQFKTLADLKGKTIGVIMGWSYGDAFDQARAAGLFHADEVTTDTANLEKLAQGRLDCVVAIDLAADHILQEMKLQDQIEKLPVPIAVNDTYLVFAKSLNQKDLLAKFNQMLNVMRQDGTYDALIHRFQNSQ